LCGEVQRSLGPEDAMFDLDRFQNAQDASHAGFGDGANVVRAATASMPVLRRGRVVRFPRERLLAWLERQEPRSARRSAHAQRTSPGPRS
jgi:hypothetical protein